MQAAPGLRMRRPVRARSARRPCAGVSRMGRLRPLLGLLFTGSQAARERDSAQPFDEWRAPLAERSTSRAAQWPLPARAPALEEAELSLKEVAVALRPHLPPDVAAEVVAFADHRQAQGFMASLTRRRWELFTRQSPQLETTPPRSWGFRFSTEGSAWSCAVRTRDEGSYWSPEASFRLDMNFANGRFLGLRGVTLLALPDGRFAHCTFEFGPRGQRSLSARVLWCPRDPDESAQGCESSSTGRVLHLSMTYR